MVVGKKIGWNSAARARALSSSEDPTTCFTEWLPRTFLHQIFLARIPEADGALYVRLPEKTMKYIENRRTEEGAHSRDATPSSAKLPRLRPERQALGQLAEVLAALAYRREGFTLLGHNLRRASGEVDLWIGRGREQYAVEVKYRRRWDPVFGVGLTGQKLRRTYTALSCLNQECQQRILGVEAVVVTPETRTLWKLYRYDWILGEPLHWASHPLILEQSKKTDP